MFLFKMRWLGYAVIVLLLGCSKTAITPGNYTSVPAPVDTRVDQFSF